MSRPPETTGESAAAVRDWVSDTIHREIPLPVGQDKVTVETTPAPGRIRPTGGRTQIGTAKPDMQVVPDHIEVIVRTAADVDADWLGDLGSRLASLAGEDSTLGARVRDSEFDAVHDVEREHSPDLGDNARRIGISLTVFRVAPRTRRSS
jgi:hypothetical protein